MSLMPLLYVRVSAEGLGLRWIGPGLTHNEPAVDSGNGFEPGTGRVVDAGVARLALRRGIRALYGKAGGLNRLRTYLRPDIVLHADAVAAPDEARRLEEVAKEAGGNRVRVWRGDELSDARVRALMDAR